MDAAPHSPSAPATSTLSRPDPEALDLLDELAVVPAPETRPRKSPPLAFEKTSNDSLWAPITSPPALISPPLASMGRLSPLHRDDAQRLQEIVEKQARLIQQLHETFAAERQVWVLERRRLHSRIASLENLLKTGDGYSPAKSPTISPHHSGSITSPQPRAISNSHRLASIAEDENIPPLSSRREGAPPSIDLSGVTPRPSHSARSDRTERTSAVSFSESSPVDVKVEEIPISPPKVIRELSPIPPEYRQDAGHTPVCARRPPTPPPQNSMSIDGIEDTPTRNNTHINTLLTQTSDDDEDKELHGPLNLPELPHAPDDTNFTFDMLSKKLQHIQDHPENSMPGVFSEPSPGLASMGNEQEPEWTPADIDMYIPLSGPSSSSSPSAVPKLTLLVLHRSTEAPMAPAATRARDSHTSELSSQALSPLSHPLSQQTSQEQHEFEQGGIKLKKKPSTNFGAPWGSLAGFGAGGVRRLS